MINFNTPRALSFLKKLQEAIESNLLENLISVNFIFSYGSGADVFKVRKAEVHFKVHHTVCSAGFVKFFNALQNDKLQWDVYRYENNYTTYLLNVDDMFVSE